MRIIIIFAGTRFLKVVPANNSHLKVYHTGPSSCFCINVLFICLHSGRVLVPARVLYSGWHHCYNFRSGASHRSHQGKGYRGLQVGCPVQ